MIKKNKECELGWVGDFLTSFASDACRDLIQLMLKVEPSKRPSAKQALMHPWFKQDEQVIK